MSSHHLRLRGMRTFAIFCIICGVVFAAGSDQPTPPKSEFSTWIYPGSKMADFLYASDAGVIDKKGQAVGFSRGQYETRASFGDVVAFYIKKSGLRIQGKDLEQFEFPSDHVFPPSGAHQVDAKGKAVNVTLAKNIQRTAATVTILVTNHPDSGTTTVTISRGIHDKMTAVQLMQHP